MHNHVYWHGDFDDPWAHLGSDKEMTGKRPKLKDRMLALNPSSAEITF